MCAVAFKKQLQTVDYNNVMAALEVRATSGPEDLTTEKYVSILGFKANAFLPVIGMISDATTYKFKMALANEGMGVVATAAGDYIDGPKYQSMNKAFRSYKAGIALACISLEELTRPHKPPTPRLVERPEMIKRELVALGDNPIRIVGGEWSVADRSIESAGQAVCSRLGTGDAETIMADGMLREFSELQWLSRTIGIYCAEEVIEPCTIESQEPAIKGALAVFGSLDAVISSAEIVTLLAIN